MSAWQTLGLGPNSDLQTIKQAYAVKIKQYRPDSHPEQFQQIHQAYKELTALLRRQTKTATANTESTAPRHTAFSHGLQFSQASDWSTLDEPACALPQDVSQQQAEMEPQQRQQSADAEQLAAQQQADAEDQRTKTELWTLQLQDESERRRTPAERWAQQLREEAERLRVEAELRAQQEQAASERRRLAAEQARQQYKQQRWQERHQRWQEQQDASERQRLAAEQARQQYEQQRQQERHQRWQEQQAFHQAMAELLQQVDDNLSDLNRLKRLQQWLFLTKSTWVLDGEFNQQLSAAILQRLVAYHKNPLTSRSTSSKGRKRHLKQPVPISVLQLLDQIFNWSGQQKRLLRGPDQQILAEIFERLELEIEEDPVDVLRGNAKVLLNEQAPAPQLRQFEWGSLIPWLILIAIVGQAFKYWQGH